MHSQRCQNDVKGDVKEFGDRPYRKPLKDPIGAVSRKNYCQLLEVYHPELQSMPFLCYDIVYKKTGRLHFSFYPQRDGITESLQPFSTHFEIKDRFEMGWKQLNCSWFRFAFLRRGEKDEFFRLDGTTASVIDMLTSLVITGIKSRRHSFRTVAGIGSRSRDLRLNLVTNFSSCISETGVNCRNETLLC